MGTQSLTRKPRSTLDDPVSNCSLQYSDFRLALNTKLSINFRIRVMVLNATFNNSSVISWRSVLLVAKL